MYRFIKSMYDNQRMSAKQVWNCADKGTITEKEALSICGPRPKSSGVAK